MIHGQEVAGGLAVGKSRYVGDRGCNMAGQGPLCSEMIISADFSASKISRHLSTYQRIHPLIKVTWHWQAIKSVARGRGRGEGRGTEDERRSKWHPEKTHNRDLILCQSDTTARIVINLTVI